MGSTKESLADIRKNIGNHAKEAPGFMQAFKQLVDSVEKESVLDAKTMELIFVGVAVAKQCTWCIELHVAAALKAGATRAEILAAAQVAVVMGGGPALMYTQVVTTALDDLAS